MPPAALMLSEPDGILDYDLDDGVVGLCTYRLDALKSRNGSKALPDGAYLSLLN